MPQTPAAVLIRLWRDAAHEAAWQTLIAAPLTLLGVFWPRSRDEEAAMPDSTADIAWTQ